MDKPSRLSKWRVIAVLGALIAAIFVLLIVARQNDWWPFASGESGANQREDKFGLNPRSPSNDEAKQTVDRLLADEPDADASDEQRTQHYATLADSALQIERCQDAQVATDRIAELLPQGAQNRYSQVYECYLKTNNESQAKAYRTAVETKIAELSEAERLLVIERFETARQRVEAQ